MKEILPMNVNCDVFGDLRDMKPFKVHEILRQINGDLGPRGWEKFKKKRRARLKATIEYAKKYADEHGTDASDEDIVERTKKSIDAEMGVAYYFGGVQGIWAWLDNEDTTVDVPTPEFNIEVKVSGSRWPTMHTSGAAPFGKATSGFNLYHSMMGKADVYLFFRMNTDNGLLEPNYFFTKRAMLQYPGDIVKNRKVGGGVYAHQYPTKYLHRYSLQQR